MKYKKIVINTCFGGFELSPLAYQEYAKLLGKKVYFFKTNFSLYDRKEIPCSLEEASKELFINVFTVPEGSAKIKENKKDWFDMSLKERGAYNKAYSDISLYSGDIKRDDPKLVKVVEKLGEKASGKFAELKIVKVPINVEWEIDEYDGLEKVEEKHKVWS